MKSALLRKRWDSGWFSVSRSSVYAILSSIYLALAESADEVRVLVLDQKYMTNLSCLSVGD